MEKIKLLTTETIDSFQKRMLGDFETVEPSEKLKNEYNKTFSKIEIFFKKLNTEPIEYKQPELLLWDKNFGSYFKHSNMIYLPKDIYNELSSDNWEEKKFELKHLISHEIIHSFSYNNVSLEKNIFTKETGVEKSVIENSKIIEHRGAFLNEGLTELINLHILNIPIDDFLELESGYSMEVSIIQELFKKIYKDDIKSLVNDYQNQGVHLLKKIKTIYGQELFDIINTMSTTLEDMSKTWNSEEELQEHLERKKDILKIIQAKKD